MQKKNATKAEIKKQRDPEKIARVIKQKGFPSGKLPRGKVLHHVIPVALGGKTTAKNTRVVTTTKHTQIHKNRKERGLI